MATNCGIIKKYLHPNRTFITSENQNTEFFKCEFFWRIAIYHNSELFWVHLKTTKSHTVHTYLVIFCVSLSLRELRGVRWLKSTSENQNTEFFKCEFFWRITIYHNSELFSVHLKTVKSHTFIMYLVIFCVSLSLRELRGVRWLKSIFMKNPRGILEI